MLIYFAFIIPIVTIVFLVIFFRKNMVWWEYLLNFCVPAILILIAKVISTTSQTHDTEIWNNFLTSASYEEEWNEWIDKTCYHTCYDQCRNSDGTTSSCNPHDCHPYDCSYCQNHPPEWSAITNSGKHISLNPYQFESYCKLWGKRNFVEMNRDYHTKDGNKFTSTPGGDINHVIPITAQHTYENRVKCSRSVFNFQDVDSEEVAEYGLYEYPRMDMFNYNPIQGYTDVKASKRLQQYNGKLGSFKQVHMMILVFKDKPISAYQSQEAYWKGGNKNEFTLCIGLKNGKTEWAKVISWTEVDELKKAVEVQVKNMPFDLVKISDYMADQVRAKFIRKQFKDFSYITVEPTTGALIWTFVLTLVLSVGLAVFNIKNDIE